MCNSQTPAQKTPFLPRLMLGKALTCRENCWQGREALCACVTNAVSPRKCSKGKRWGVLPGLVLTEVKTAWWKNDLSVGKTRNPLQLSKLITHKFHISVISPTVPKKWAAARRVSLWVGSVTSFPAHSWDDGISPSASETESHKRSASQALPPRTCLTWKAFP